MVFAAHVTMDTSVTPCVHATDSIIQRSPPGPSLPDMQWSAHDSGCRLARGLDVHPYVSAPAVAGPKVPRQDGAVVGPARSAASGPVCSSVAHGDWIPYPSCLLHGLSSQSGRATDRMGYNGDIATLDLRDCCVTTLVHMARVRHPLESYVSELLGLRPLARIVW